MLFMHMVEGAIYCTIQIIKYQVALIKNKIKIIWRSHQPILEIFQMRTLLSASKEVAENYV